ncbi:MAG: 50S ribosomal protein L4 [Malacoplasma sp.]
MNNIKYFLDLKGNEKIITVKNTDLILKTINEQSIFNCILAENNGDRQGTHSTLTKGEVRGGGKKPWRQKHTGKARQGSIRNPHWVGGGVAFGPKPTRNYKLKVNSKVHKLAFKSAITLKFNEKAISFLNDKIDIKKPSTKLVATFVDKIKYNDKKILFVLNDENDDFIKSCNNMPLVSSKLWNQVSIRDIINSDYTIIQESAFNNISEVFA